ncbi:hypothetical protein EG866_15860, partial [Enterococcus faecalis]
RAARAHVHADRARGAPRAALAHDGRGARRLGHPRRRGLPRRALARAGVAGAAGQHRALGRRVRRAERDRGGGGARRHGPGPGRVAGLRRRALRAHGPHAGPRRRERRPRRLRAGAAAPGGPR